MRNREAKAPRVFRISIPLLPVTRRGATDRTVPTVRATESGSECSRSLLLQVRRDVTIDICRNGIRAVTQALLHDLHRRTKPKQHACVGVAQS
jgi:hypothetical protein